MDNISIDNLSFTISELVDLDSDQQNLVESAVNRAISAKDIAGGLGQSTHPPIFAGGLLPPCNNLI